jgi:hypothetical protein
MKIDAIVGFELCGAHFLLQWKRKEERFHTLLRSDPSVDVVRSALSFFIIARNFSGIKKDKAVAQHILNMLLETDGANIMSMEEKVTTLASKFKERFGKNNISAASKLLWLKNRAPYIIYDSRAERTLKAMGAKFKSRDYHKYCAAWREAFEENKPNILKAVRRLRHIKKILPDWKQSTEETMSMVQSQWFLERVFDIYLYQNSEGV